MDYQCAPLTDEMRGSPWTSHTVTAEPGEFRTPSSSLIQSIHHFHMLPPVPRATCRRTGWAREQSRKEVMESLWPPSRVEGRGAGAGRRGRREGRPGGGERGAGRTCWGCGPPCGRSPRSGSGPWDGRPSRCGCCWRCCCCRQRRCSRRCARRPARSPAAARPTAPCAAPARGPASADCEYAAPPPRHPPAAWPPCSLTPFTWMLG